MGLKGQINKPKIRREDKRPGTEKSGRRRVKNTFGVANIDEKNTFENCSVEINHRSLGK